MFYNSIWLLLVGIFICDAQNFSREFMRSHLKGHLFWSAYTRASGIQYVYEYIVFKYAHIHIHARNVCYFIECRPYAEILRANGVVFAISFKSNAQFISALNGKVLHSYDLLCVCSLRGTGFMTLCGSPKWVLLIRYRLSLSLLFYFNNPIASDISSFHWRS